MNRFRSLAIQYLQNASYDGLEVRMNEEAIRAREGINTLLMEAYQAIHTAGINPGITYTSAPIAGARTSHVDTITNIFNLHIYDMGLTEVLDFIDRAPGVSDERYGCGIGETEGNIRRLTDIALRTGVICPVWPRMGLRICGGNHLVR